jgi:predicted DNA binding CopG/RHH family protein
MKLKMPVFKNESEEADWWFANRKKVERELRKAKPLTDSNGKRLTPAQIAEAHIAEQNKTKPISIRISEGDLELAKKMAQSKGIGYQTYIRMLLHEALRKTG